MSIKKAKEILYDIDELNPWRTRERINEAIAELDAISERTMSVDELAQAIRIVDGNHTLGAVALAEAVIAHLKAATKA